MYFQKRSTGRTRERKNKVANMVENEPKGESQKKPRLIYKDTWVVLDPDKVDPDWDVDDAIDRKEEEERNDFPNDDWESGDDRFYQ